jgi:hypothetical protein
MALMEAAMRIETISDFRAAMRNGPYAWPGGYPLFFVTHDCAALSFKAVKENRRQILHAIANKSHDGWRVIGLEINWEDPDLYCEHTGDPIPSAYGEG